MNIRHTLEFARDELVYGGHLVSLSAISIAYTLAELLGINITWDFLAIVYLIFYVIYAYDRLRKMKGDYLTNPDRAAHIASYSNLLPWVICLAAAIMVMFSVRSGNHASVVIACLMTLSGILYTEGLKMLTQKIVGFKSLYVTFVWTLQVPLLTSYYGVAFGTAALLVAIFFFLNCAVNVIFCDIKDIEADSKSGLKTFPIVMGKEGVLNFLHIINIMAFIPIIYGVYVNVLPGSALVLLPFVFYGADYLYMATDVRSNIKNISYVMVDGEYVLWPIAILIYKELIKLVC